MPTVHVDNYQQNNVMSIEKEIAARIVALRKEQKLTQEDLAGMADLDRSYLSEIENGHKNLSLRTLEKIAKALNVKMSDLLKEAE